MLHFGEVREKAIISLSAKNLTERQRREAEKEIRLRSRMKLRPVRIRVRVRVRVKVSVRNRANIRVRVKCGNNGVTSRVKISYHKLVVVAFRIGSKEGWAPPRPA